MKSRETQVKMRNRYRRNRNGNGKRLRKHDKEHVTTYPHSILWYCRYLTDVQGVLTIRETQGEKVGTAGYTVHLQKQRIGSTGRDTLGHRG